MYKVTKCSSRQYSSLEPEAQSVVEVTDLVEFVCCSYTGLR